MRSTCFPERIRSLQFLKKPVRASGLVFLLDDPAGFRFPMGRMQCHADTAEAMENLGRSFAEGIQPGTVIALVGGLGAGKTHWTKGFVAGIGSTAEVTSPTFGLVHEYPGGKLPVFHLDFYRLESADELIGLGWDEYLEADGVIVAEWADKFPELLPAATRWLSFSIKADGSRTILEENP